MYKTPLNNQETDKERNIIYQIGYENGYNKNTQIKPVSYTHLLWLPTLPVILLKC